MFSSPGDCLPMPSVCNSLRRQTTHTAGTVLEHFGACQFGVLTLCRTCLSAAGILRRIRKGVLEYTSRTLCPVRRPFAEATRSRRANARGASLESRPDCQGYQRVGAWGEEASFPTYRTRDCGRARALRKRARLAVGSRAETWQCRYFQCIDDRFEVQPAYALDAPIGPGKGTGRDRHLLAGGQAAHPYRYGRCRQDPPCCS